MRVMTPSPGPRQPAQGASASAEGTSVMGEGDASTKQVEYEPQRTG
jgi:hypothetical protein